MPSFAIHNICGLELLNRLNVNDSDRYRFIIGNVLPDVSRIKRFNELDDFSKIKAIQNKKEETHFRKNTGKIIEYPDCDGFLSKYKKNLANDIVLLAYFFHLYTDYYYFKNILSRSITFYDKDMKLTDTRINFKYVKINKTGEIILGSEFFSKKNPKSIYKEYSRCNCYLAKKYKFKVDIRSLIEYVDENGFVANIEETNSLYAYYAIRKIEKYVNDIDIKDDNLQVFNYEDLDSLVNEVIDTFMKKYSKYLVNYCKDM